MVPGLDGMWDDQRATTDHEKGHDDWLHLHAWTCYVGRHHSYHHYHDMNGGFFIFFDRERRLLMHSGLRAVDLSVSPTLLFGAWTTNGACNDGVRSKISMIKFINFDINDSIKQKTYTIVTNL